MKPRLLKSLLALNLSLGGSKKIKLFLNVGIFLSIFAITASISSIYFESKISKLESRIFSNNSLNDVLSISSNFLPKKINNLEKVLENINMKEDIIVFFYLSKSGEVFSTRELYYMPTMSLKGWLTKQLEVIDSLELMFNYQGKDKELFKTSDKDKLNQIIKTVKLDRKKYNKINEEIEKQHKNIKKIDGQKLITDNNFYQPYENYLPQLVKISNNLIKLYIEGNKYLREIHNNIENENGTLRNQISQNSKLSKNFIVVAFFLQLIVFVIIQIMEIISTRRELNEK